MTMLSEGVGVEEVHFNQATLRTEDIDCKTLGGVLQGYYRTFVEVTSGQKRTRRAGLLSESAKELTGKLRLLDCITPGA